MTNPFVLMYDGIHDDVPSIPPDAVKVAGYVSGANHGFWWTAGDWARFPKAGHVRIDTDGSKPLDSDVVDCEAGDVTPTGAAHWAATRQAHGWWSAIYCSESQLPAVRAACAAARVTKVGYWIANWSLTQDEAVAKLVGDIFAVQFTSPSVRPGQRYDLSVARPQWFPAPTPPKPPAPAALDGILITLAPGNAANTYVGRHVASHDGGHTWA